MCIYHGNSVGLNIFKLTKLESIFSCVPRPLLRNLGQLWQLLNLFIYLRVIYLFMKETLLTRLLPPPFLYPSSLLDLLSLSLCIRHWHWEWRAKRQCYAGESN